MEYLINLTFAIQEAEKFVEEIPIEQVNQLVILDKLRRLKKRGLVGKMGCLEEDQKVLAVDIRKLKGILFVNKIKEILGCLKCNEKHIACLEFHHIDQSKKSFSIAQAPTKYLSIDSIAHEIRKCILICSNCHKKEHYSEV